MKNNWRQILVIGLIVLSVFWVTYCSKEKKEPEKVLTEKEIRENKYSSADSELEENQEKIALLSFIKNIPKDSINLIIREYLMETEYDDVFFEKNIEKVSKKYSMSSKKVASIIFSYKYEVLTKDEIEEKVIEELSEVQSHYNEENTKPDGYNGRY